jgi:hypothetical protein
LIKQTNETWLNNKWRPAVAWAYLVICCFDFIVAPVGWSILQAMQSGIVNQQWEPITLAGAGLFHAAMGAVLGINSWTRGREKVERERSYRGDYYGRYDRDEGYDDSRGSRWDDDDMPQVTYRARNRNG